MTDAEIVKNFKLVQDQINELTKSLNMYAEALHKTNSDAIDDIVITLLNQDQKTSIENNGGGSDV